VHLANWKRRRHFTLCVCRSDFCYIKNTHFWHFWRQNLQKPRYPQSLRFAIQSGRLETNLWHNSLKCVRRLFNPHDTSISFYFCPYDFILSFSALFLFSLCTYGSTLDPNRDPLAGVLLLSEVAPPFLIHPSYHVFQEQLKIKLILILMVKKNSNFNNFKKKYCKKILCFRIMLTWKYDFLEKRVSSSRKSQLLSRYCSLTEYVKSFEEFSVFKICLQTGR
jgi:hypothetical protein